MLSRIKTAPGSCGCAVPTARVHQGKLAFTCSMCSGKCCPDHYYFAVDGNNRSITATLFRQGICSACYENKTRNPKP